MGAKPFATFALGLIAGLLIPALVVYGYFRFGYAPVATAAPPIPFEKTAARMALRARIAKEAPTTVPLQADEPNLLGGAKVFRENCAVCHSQPKRPPTAIANGMYPTPPHLFDDPVTDDPVGMTYWKATNGIRMTGMPAFRSSLSDTQRWQVSLMLAAADKLSPAVQEVLSAPLTEPPGAGEQHDQTESISPHASRRR